MQDQEQQHVKERKSKPRERGALERVSIGKEEFDREKKAKRGRRQGHQVPLWLSFHAGEGDVGQRMDPGNETILTNEEWKVETRVVACKPSIPRQTL